MADSAMIDIDNRTYMEKSKFIDYIIGDRIKNLPKIISEKLTDKSLHQALGSSKEVFSYTRVEYQGRKIICTCSQRRANKDRAEREKIIQKGQKLTINPFQLKQTKKRGAARFIQQQTEEKYTLDEQESNQKETFYIRSKITKEQDQIIKKLKLIVPKDTTTPKAINQYFI